MNPVSRQTLHGRSELPETATGHEQIRLSKELGRLVHDRRTEAGVSEEDLAVCLGLTPEAVERIELGGVLPITCELLLRIAAALDVAVELCLASTSSAVRFEAGAA
ncbi:helix-turn-helix transcriptional regulator [Streptomyces gamaensis]|uniref:Helix-turn-helix transcriptional regulator n=1 Tax=Streptomyces gamaensis TaxID=1763542 RepID=A0ABW0YY24_9ACTN